MNANTCRVLLAHHSACSPSTCTSITHLCQCRRFEETALPEVCDGSASVTAGALCVWHERLHSCANLALALPDALLTGRVGASLLPPPCLCRRPVVNLPLPPQLQGDPGAPVHAQLAGGGDAAAEQEAVRDQRALCTAWLASCARCCLLIRGDPCTRVCLHSPPHARTSSACCRWAGRCRCSRQALAVRRRWRCVSAVAALRIAQG